MSPSYVASRWCQDEARLFAQRFAGDLTGRVFVVEKAPLDDGTAIPQALTGLVNYRFWYRDRNEQPRTLAKPMPQQEEIRYFRQVEDIARDIHRQLKVMGGRPADVSPALPLQRATRPPTGSRANGGNGAGVAFLAEVTDDLERATRMLLCFASTITSPKAGSRAASPATPTRSSPKLPAICPSAPKPLGACSAC